MSDYSTSDYWGVIETVQTPTLFFLDRYFKIKHNSEQPEIKFDQVSKEISVMAPFVSPLAVADTNKSKGYQAETFTPAYLKEKDMLTPSQGVTRLAGEPLNGNLTPAQRTDRNRVDIVAEHKSKMRARWEWLAAMVTLHAKVTISGKNYPTRVLDFGRDPGHHIVITDANKKWDNVDANIHDQLEDYSHIISKAVGSAGTDVIMNQETWKHVRKNKGLKEDADLRRGITSVPNLSPDAEAFISYKGSYGDFNIYVHNGEYKDVDGLMKPYIEDGYVHMVAPTGSDGKAGIHGIQGFGRVHDFDADEGLFDIFTKDWREKEPSGEVILSQSAPLMIPGRPNATLKIKVF
jgi:hypothetical protein